MIDIRDSKITDLLPPHIAEDVEVQAIAYAALMEKRRLLELADKTRTHAYIDQLSEDILDVLAVELRAPYYDQGMDVEVKRKIIKNTLIWHTKAGTPAAVKELIQAAFGSGDLVEWFDFEDPPYTRGTFDIITEEQMTSGMLDYFYAVVYRVKNTRSHIRQIVVRRKTSGGIYIGVDMLTTPRETLIPQIKKTVNPAGGLFAGAAVVPRGKTKAIDAHRLRTLSMKESLSAGALCTTRSHTVIIGQRDGAIQAAGRAAGGGLMVQKKRITV